MKAELLITPYKYIGLLKERIPANLYWTFGSAIMIGLVNHLYMFTNKLPNHDDVSVFYYKYSATSSGRWLIENLNLLDGVYSTPLLLGILGLIFLALTSCIIVSIFELKHRISCVLISTILVSFPVVTATYSFMFTSDLYFFSLMLAVLGGYLAIRFPRAGSLMCVVCITLSMAIYQAYFPVVAAIMVGYLALEVLNGNKSYQQIILHGIRLVVVLAVSMAVYMITVKITTAKTGLASYQGISDMGKIDFSQLPSLILSCYKRYFEFFIFNPVHKFLNILRWPLILSGIATFVLLALLLWKQKLGIVRSALVVILAMLYPLAGALIYVMAPYSKGQTLEEYGIIVILLIPIVLSDYSQKYISSWKPVHQIVTSIMCWIILCTMCITGYSYTVCNNEAYLSMQIAFEQIKGYSSQLVSNVTQCEGYQKEFPVVLIGHNNSSSAQNVYSIWDQNINLRGILDFADYRTSYSYHYLLYYLGFPNIIYYENSSEGIAEIVQSDRVQNMPIYPLEGSIEVVDGYIFVKMG